MASEIVERFIDGLKRAEEAHDPAPVAELFADDAELINLARKEPARGKEGAQRFWADYLHAFGKVRSEFFHVFEGEGSAALEWNADGELPNGKPIRYRGISILDTADGHVKRFRTYYDSAAFVAPPATTDVAPADAPAGEAADPDPDTAG